MESVILLPNPHQYTTFVFKASSDKVLKGFSCWHSMSGLRKTLLLAGNTSGANSTTRLRPTTPWAGVAVEIIG